MDHITRNIRHVLRSTYSSSTPNLSSSMILTTTGPNLRHPLRQLRPPLDTPRRNTLPRLRPNDGLPLNRILPIHPLPRNLQSPRRKRNLQRLRQLSQHLVRQTACLRSGHHGLGIQFGRCDLSHHGLAFDSAGGICVGDEDLCFSHSLHAGYFEPDVEVEVDASEERCLDYELC